MKEELEFRSVSNADDIRIAAGIIARANQPVAKKLGLNPENAPTHPAYITPEGLASQVTDRRDFYLLYESGKAVGTIAVEPSSDDPSLFYIMRLAVLSNLQGQGRGTALMEHAYRVIRRSGGSSASVAIINEYAELKAWYEHLGFRETAQKSFSHLPFTVCFMKKELT